MKTDVLVIGAGLAGLACALGCGDAAVIVVNDTEPAADVASAWAQGGLAAALGADDTPALHAVDTLAAAGGIADGPTVRDLTADAPAAIALLERFGVPFDRREDGSLALGLEAAHSRRRIVHAADHTGASVVRSLLDAVAARPSIAVRTGLRSIELLQARDGRIGGAVFMDRSGAVLRIDAGSVVLACGGYGGLFARTTTPPATLGAGIAMAGRAGATLADLEFVQFHPTALAARADPLALVSEAVRGEGAVLVDERGERFVDELAPRDIVARAIFAREEGGGRAFLDARTALGARFAGRFPTIAARCAAIGVDPAVNLIPVTPAAHYTIGGVATDGRGRTDLPGLWACGEVAATGLHGANRLASNSLMEALVFGTRAARDILGAAPVRRAPAVRALQAASVPLVGDLRAALAPLRRVMSDDAGVVRDAAGLERALDRCDAFARLPACADPRLRDAVVVARAVAGAALARRESRGSHFRRDFSAADVRLSSRAFVAGPVSASATAAMS
jgi:L-aspartate oxidase